MKVKVPDLNELMPEGYTIQGNDTEVAIDGPNGTIKMSISEFERLLNEDFAVRFAAWCDEQVDEAIQGNRKPGDPEPKGLLFTKE